MYAIATVVYGVPVDERLDRYAQQAELELEELGFELLYSGSSAISPGYLGVALCDLRTLDDYTSVADLRLQPSPEERLRAEGLVAALPQAVRAVTLPLDVYIVWSTS